MDLEFFEGIIYWDPYIITEVFCLLRYTWIIIGDTHNSNGLEILRL